MGAMGGEELTQWDKMQGGADAREEKILVLVRLRPLSDKEIVRNEVSDWECINQTTILYRNSLQERSGLPTAYSFDRVFRGDCSTKEVYEEGAKEIALSVVGGINSTIFAYGQTSSGKTYTMVGITEYTVADIYDYIQRHEERAFVLKFSAMEIYNEAIRDLLSTDSTSLRVLDDPEKGTIVEKLTEETLRDWSHLKELLSICEALRRTGETNLNETSSRSHQILRLTIESSAREFLGKDKSTTLSASVNFVDLAGSERASQALSAGARLKEGCHINRSLLTLGTVIRKLSKGRHGHINYRDSKLTRILQPSLGGNARTAIICTLSPAQSHVEQSRNTLLFASCAKEVTTNAQVNVVMSDKALVKQLQKELARLESELRSPVPTSYPCDYVALLRKKDLHIAKMEKEIRELAKQRDLAQSRVGDLLQEIANNQTSRQWEEECSVSESSGVNDPHRLDLSTGSKFDKSDPFQGREQRAVETGEDTDDLCKEVRCIEMEGAKEDENPEFNALVNGETARMSELPASGNVAVTNQQIRLPNGDSIRSNIQNGFTYGMLEQRFQDVQNTIDSLVCQYPEEPSPRPLDADMLSSRSLKLARSWSSKKDFKNGSSSPWLENAEHIENSPPYGSERDFPGRPEGFGRKIPPLHYDVNMARLSRNDSQSSIGSALIDELKAQTFDTPADEDITSIHTFVAGLKEARLQYENQVVDGQFHEMGPKDDKSERNVKDVGLDPMHDALVTSSDWPQEFERQQKLIFELWESCNVSLVHRTYFFLLFKGEPTDSIYMEVEVRRLTFLKQTFSRRNQAAEDDPTLTLASSIKALRREREMLIKLMQRRFTENERNGLYHKWGIALESKRRRLQLVNHLWSNTNNMNHVTESATIVAKLVKFSEQGQALKEMFGLSFTHPRLRRRSFGWKHSSSRKALL